MAVLLNLSPEEFSRTFNAIETHRVDAIGRGVLSAALAGAEVIAENAPKDLGSLKQSVHAVKGTPVKIVVDAPHAGIVEMGSRPHVAPLLPLVEWAKRHGAETEADAYRMAWGIRKKIAAEGTKPTYFVRKSLPKLFRILKGEIEHELKNVGR